MQSSRRPTHTPERRSRGSVLGRALAVASLGASALGAADCLSNPAVDEVIASLGAEKSGVRKGPLHRGGQPCLVCHGGTGPGSPDFSVAGTIYATPTDATPVNAASILITDATGKQKEVFSNCAGNFVTDAKSFVPIYPLRVEVVCELPLPAGAPASTPKQTRRSVMQTRISRDGSCSSCHFGDPSESSPGRLSCGVAQPDPPFTQLAGCFAGGG